MLSPPSRGAALGSIPRPLAPTDAPARHRPQSRILEPSFAATREQENGATMFYFAFSLRAPPLPHTPWRTPPL